jgi:hypothetical protein
MPPEYAKPTTVSSQLRTRCQRFDRFTRASQSRRIRLTWVVVYAVRQRQIYAAPRSSEVHRVTKNKSSVSDLSIEQLASNSASTSPFFRMNSFLAAE